MSRLKKVGRRVLGGGWPFFVWVWWRVRLLTSFTQPLLLRQLAQLRAQRRARPAAAAGRILFFASRQERDQLAVLSLLSASLVQRGQAVSVAACDGLMPKCCNSFYVGNVSSWGCRNCALFARTTHEVAGADVDFLGDLVTPTQRDEASRAVATLRLDELRSFEYRGLALGHIVRHSVAHFLRTDRIDEGPDAERVYRLWLEAGILVADACDVLIDRRRPDVVVMLNGLIAPEWIMREVARRRGVRVVTWEVGFRPRTFFFRHNEPTDMADAALWQQFKNQPLTGHERAAITEYLARRSRGGGYLLTYFPTLEDSHATICHEFGIEPGKKTFVLFPNLTWDSSLFERDVAFNGMREWIADTIRFFAVEPAAQLVIRVHPAEVFFPGASVDSVAAMIRRDFPALPANVIVVPPGSSASSYALMDLADCGLMYGSTTGIELGVRGVPIVLAGDVYYRGLGLTVDPSTRAEYFEALSAMVRGTGARRSESLAEAWLRYAFFAIFRAAIPLWAVRYDNIDETPELEPISACDIEAGADPNLDLICLGITQGTPFVVSDTESVLAMGPR